ncbi:DUF4349 domain-containing protein [Nocardioides renjunii]|uniref:DUF4349 domain-containing protein n=1 Tax=Nocardioides renjunii TaxID=3095075 RepID=UPI002AFED14A|nr:DUF4349 domain-containing protein [Nocardioides sp. S-34]WQQ21594.1 DUF4349 domain-containing protein [Nocardioides sp. S-34]
MTTRTRAAGVLTALTMSVLMAACSTSDGGGDALGESSSGADRSTGQDLAGSDGAGGGTSRELAAAEDATSSESSGSSGPARPSGSGSQVATTPELERAVISTGTVSLSSKDVAGARQDVQRIVDAQGGDVTEESTETDEDGEASYARLVVRVPSGRFSEAMAALEGVDGVVASNRGSEDVTTQVIDNDVRVRAQEASLKRVERLLAEATSLRNLIWIESQLTTRQAELDSLKSQQSWLTDQTSLSTITIDISADRAKPVKKDEADEPAGFVAGLSGGMDALTSVLGAAATVIGALLPFAVLGLVVGVPVWVVVRRRRATTPAAAETPAA